MTNAALLLRLLLDEMCARIAAERETEELRERLYAVTTGLQQQMLSAAERSGRQRRQELDAFIAFLEG